MKVTETKGSQKDRQALFSMAGTIAVRQAENMGLPITCTEGTQIIKRYPDGHKEVLGIVPPDIPVTSKTIKISVE
ncbi:MAG: hypothetical protein IJQ86_02320 [Spirochaetia bacterium]|nr:hypothetical protein [Spirochaetia bacterium]